MSITRQQTSALKGLAITAIALHTISRWITVPACVVLILLTALTPYTFMLGGTVFVLLLLLFRHIIGRSRTLMYLGSISAALYVIHPSVRQVIIHYLHKFHLAVSPALVAMTVLVISVPAAHLYTYLLRKAGHQQPRP